MERLIQRLRRLIPLTLIGAFLLTLSACAPGTHVYASPDYYEYGYSPDGYHRHKPGKHKKFKKKYKKYKKYKKHHHHDDWDD